MELPFELHENHKWWVRNRWLIKWNMKMSEEEFEELYNRYIVCDKCELCNTKFKSVYDRQMEHDHETGKFRNIVCQSCNQRKKDVKLRKDNTSGYKGIYKKKRKTTKTGYTWVFQARIDGKLKDIKSSIDLDKLVAFAEEWKKQNNYYK